jgi:hypothetical protein
MKTIKEIKTKMNNNESAITKGVYQKESGYLWITFTKSGECKTLKTALRKAGL